MVYDGNGNPQNWLIDSITPDADALTYTIKIKEGIKFSDGSDLNADAVAWNLNKYKAEGVMSASQSLTMLRLPAIMRSSATSAVGILCSPTRWHVPAPSPRRKPIITTAATRMPTATS